ncbi:MAG: chloride channel protein, partial [Kiritimatiellae bacterium]|nr:chloride channel protein [Kiritimatiellia bacterium]
MKKGAKGCGRCARRTARFGARRFLALLRLWRTTGDDTGLGMVRALVLSVVVGVFAGAGAIALAALLQFCDLTLLGRLAHVATGGAAHEPDVFGAGAPYGAPRLWLLPLLAGAGGLASGLLAWFFAPEAAGHGTDAAIEAYHFRGGRVRPVAVPVKAVATSILIGTGGSAGCEGPITQIGAGFGSMLADSLRLPVATRRKLMAAGMGAGVGALFHAPLAGALFAAELLYRDLDLEYEVLVPAIVASVTSHTLYSRVFGFSPLFEMPQNAFSRPHMLLLYLALAVVLALGARFYTWAFWTVHERFANLKMPAWLKPALGGIATGLLGMAFLPALGAGYGALQEILLFSTPSDAAAALGGSAAAACAALVVFFFAKTAATAFSVGSGGSGGIFGPAIVCGGTLGGAVGIAFGTILPGWGVNVGSFALVGMVAFFGCAAKAPISMILMIGEMTGNHRLLVPSMWVVIVAYLLTRKVSLYRSQLPNRFEAQVHRGDVVRGTLGSLTARDVLGARRGPA